MHDCQWLQRLHTFGLLAGAFRPVDQVGVLRSYLRQGVMRLTYAGQHIQHLQKALTQMNIRLQHVVSELTGVTGMAIIRAVLGGDRNPVTLAQLRDYRCHQHQEAIAKASHGQWREEHLFALAQAVALYDVYHQKIAECDPQIEVHWATFADKRQGQALPSGPRPRTRKRKQPAFEVRGPTSSHHRRRPDGH